MPSAGRVFSAICIPNAAKPAKQGRHQSTYVVCSCQQGAWAQTSAFGETCLKLPHLLQPPHANDAAMQARQPLDLAVKDLCAGPAGEVSPNIPMKGLELPYLQAGVDLVCWRIGDGVIFCHGLASKSTG